MAKFLAYSATVIIIVAVIGFSLEVKAENIDCAPVLLLEKSLTCAEDITVLSECIEQFKTIMPPKPETQTKKK